jgi:multisubunit Na+/H+ antiporter MnhG subunit
VRAALLGLGIVSLLAVVALAARGGHPNGHGRASDREVPASLQDSLVTLIAIVYVLTVLALIYAFVRYRGDWAPQKSRWLLNFFMALILMAVVVPVGYRAIMDSHIREKAKKAQQQTQQEANARRRARDKRPKPIPGRTAEFNWSLTLAIGGLLVIGGALLVLRRRPLRSAAHGLSVAEELSLVAAASIDDLRREPDARKAVIAAYANMERVLAAGGLPRRRAEAPFEYLARILRQLEVREDAVRGLTELFERAKFSTHEIDAAMKEEAIAAFAALRADLRADEAVAA